MKRSPLKRGKPIARKPMRRRPRSTKYSRRERNWDYMAWIKLQPCLLAVGIPAHDLWRGTLFVLIAPCDGPVEAHHAGRHGLGNKAPDDHCLPLCRGHHRSRTDLAGAFGGWPTGAIAEWEDRLIQAFREAYQHAATANHGLALF